MSGIFSGKPFRDFWINGKISKCCPSWKVRLKTRLENEAAIKSLYFKVRIVTLFQAGNKKYDLQENKIFYLIYFIGRQLQIQQSSEQYTQQFPMFS